VVERGDKWAVKKRGILEEEEARRRAARGLSAVASAVPDVSLASPDEVAAHPGAVLGRTRRIESSTVAAVAVVPKPYVAVPTMLLGYGDARAAARDKAKSVFAFQRSEVSMVRTPLMTPTGVFFLVQYGRSRVTSGGDLITLRSLRFLGGHDSVADAIGHGQAIAARSSTAAAGAEAGGLSFAPLPTDPVALRAFMSSPDLFFVHGGASGHVVQAASSRNLMLVGDVSTMNVANMAPAATDPKTQAVTLIDVDWDLLPAGGVHRAGTGVKTMSAVTRVLGVFSTERHAARRAKLLTSGLGLQAYGTSSSSGGMANPSSEQQTEMIERLAIVPTGRWFSFDRATLRAHSCRRLLRPRSLASPVKSERERPISPLRSLSSRRRGKKISPLLEAAVDDEASVFSASSSTINTTVTLLDQNSVADSTTGSGRPTTVHGAFRAARAAVEFDDALRKSATAMKLQLIDGSKSGADPLSPSATALARMHSRWHKVEIDRARTQEGINEAISRLEVSRRLLFTSPVARRPSPVAAR